MYTKIVFPTWIQKNGTLIDTSFLKFLNIPLKSRHLRLALMK